MLAHSVLHGGPGLHGICPAGIHYWITDDINKNPPTLEYENVADYDLRELIKQ